MIAPETLAARRAAFIEDVEFLIDQGADMTEVCRRLGLVRHTVVNKLQEFERTDLLVRLAPGFKPRRDRVPLKPVADHVRSLQRAKWTLAHIAVAADVGTSTVDRIVYGKAKTVGRDIAEKILAVTGTPAEASLAARDWAIMQPGWTRDHTREVA